MTAVTGWTVHFRRSDSSDVNSLSYDANANRGMLTELDKGASYIVLVAANNTGGMGPFTERMITTLIDRKRFVVMKNY